MAKHKNKKMVKEMDDQDCMVDKPDAGVPGLFQPSEFDIAEELQGNEALWEHRRGQISDL